MTLKYEKLSIYSTFLLKKMVPFKISFPNNERFYGHKILKMPSLTHSRLKANSFDSMKYILQIFEIFDNRKYLGCI